MRKVVIMTLYLFFGLASSIEASVLSNAASQMQPGQWTTISTSNFFPGGRSILTPSGGGTILEYSDEAIWNSNTSELFILGAAHNTFASESGFAKYVESTNTWSAVPIPPISFLGHAYDNHGFDPSTGDIYHHQYSSLNVHKFSTGSQTWSLLPSIPSSLATVYVNIGGAEYFPELGGLLVLNGGGGGNEGQLYFWKKSTNSWSRLAQGLTVGAYSNVLEYNPIHKVVLFGGGGGSNSVYVINSAGSVSQKSNSPYSLSQARTLLTVDPGTGKFLCLFGSNNQFWEYDVVKDTWTQLNPSGVPLFSSGWSEGTIFNVVATPIFQYGVNIFVKWLGPTNATIYLYKHSSGSALPPPPTDTLAPTVPTSLSKTVASESQINLSWTASTDNVGVVGYKVFRNASQIGTSSTTNFSDTGLSPSTTYSYSVSAYDASGNNSSQSASISGTTAAAPAPPPSSDFTTRCSASGVVKCVGFDSSAEAPQTTWPNSPAIIPVGGTSTYRGSLDTSVKASGASSLRFVIPSNTPADTSGSFYTNFSNDLSVQFGESQEFYVQWRQRFSPELISTLYLKDDGSSANGWKQVIIGEGDRPGSPTTSCTSLETVVQNTSQRKFPQMYHNCGTYANLYEPYGSYDFKLQNVVAAPYCLYSNGGTVPPCVGYVPNTWMTFQVHIKVGNWGQPNSTVELWVGQEGKSSVKVISFTNWVLKNDNPTQARYGKVWLIPYHSNKGSAQSTPTAYTWYDDLIISRSKIADPVSAGSDTTPPNPPANLTVN